MDESPIVYMWGPFVVMEAPDRVPPIGVLFSQQYGPTSALRVATSLEKQRLLNHLLEAPQSAEGEHDSKALKLIQWLRLELGEP